MSMSDKAKISTISRGTTIVSIPFKEGVVIVSDTQATDTSSFEIYACENKTTNSLGYTLGGSTQFYISGSGAAIGTSVVMFPFLSYFEKKCIKFVVDLSLLDRPQFENFYNNIGANYLSEMTPLQYEIANASHFLVTIKTKNFLQSYKCGGYPGGLLVRATLKGAEVKGQLSNLIGTGSGCRYILGSLLVENQKRCLLQWTEEELLAWIQAYFSYSIQLDAASNTRDGLNVRIIYSDSRPSKLTIF